MIRRIGNTFIAHKIRFNLCSLITHRNTVSTLFFDVINFGKRTRNTTSGLIITMCPIRYLSIPNSIFHSRFRQVTFHTFMFLTYFSCWGHFLSVQNFMVESLQYKPSSFENGVNVG